LVQAPDARAAEIRWRNAASGNWFDGAAWEGGAVPGAADVAVLDQAGANHVVTVNGSPTVAGIRLGSPNVTLRAQSVTLTVSGPLEVQDGTLDLRAATLSGAGALTVAGALVLREVVTINLPITSSGTTTLQADGTYGHATVTANAAWLNTGTVSLTTSSIYYNATLAMGAGVQFTNAVGGTLQSLAGSGTTRFLSGNFLNQGTVLIGNATQLGAGTYVNEGIWRITADSVTMAGAGRVFRQTSGTLEAGAGGFVANASRVEFLGGDATGTLYLNGATLQDQSNGTGNFVVWGSSTLEGNIAAGQTVTVQAHGSVGHAVLSHATGFTNRGTIHLTSNTIYYNATLAVTAGEMSNLGTVTTQVGSGAGRIIAASFTNDGTMTFNHDVTLSKTNGVFNNRLSMATAAGASVSLSGNGQRFNQVSGLLANTGGVTVDNATFDFSGGTVTGNPVLVRGGALLVSSTGAGSITARGTVSFTGNLAATQSLLVQGDGSWGHAVLNVQGDAFNAGTITSTTNSIYYFSSINIGGTLTNAGTLTFAAGVGANRYVNGNVVNTGTVGVANSTWMQGTGALFENQGTVVVAAGVTLTVDARGQTYRQAAGQTDVDGTLWVRSAELELTGGDILGTIHLADAALFLASEGSGTLVARGSCTAEGDVPAALTVRVQGDGSQGHAVTTWANAFNNRGTILLDANTVYYNATLNVTAGVLLNDGQVRAIPGSGTSRYVNASVTNRGQFTADYDVNFNKTGAVFINQGQVDVAAGRAMSINGAGQTFRQESGSILADGGLHVLDATTLLLGGAVAGGLGRIYARNGSVTFAAGATGGVLARGTVTLASDIFVGQWLTLEGDGGVGHATLNHAGPLANGGALTLTTNTVYYNATVNSGTITNTGSITSAGGSTSRTINATLLNQGVFTAGYPVTLGVAGAAHVNDGLFNVGATVTLVGTSFENRQTGTLSGTSTFNAGTLTIPTPGTLNPGGAPGNLVLQGGLAMDANTRFNAELGGTTPGTGHDRLQANRPVSINGTLTISLVNSFAPAVGQTFQVLTCNPCSGAFHTVTGPDISSTGAFEVQYTSTAVTVRISRLPSFVLTTSTPTPVAGVPLDLTVQAVDVNNNPDPTYVGSVLFSSADSAAELPLPYTFTAADLGQKSFPGGLTMRTAGPMLVRGISGENTLMRGSVVLNVSASAVNADVSTINAAPNSLEANGVAQSTITVTPKDDFGNNVGAGHTVAITTTLGTLVGAVVDVGNGTYTQQLQAGLTPGNANVRATVDGVLLSTQRLVQLRQDTTAPGPVVLSAAAVGSSVVNLAWTPSGSPDVVGHLATRWDTTTAQPAVDVGNGTTAPVTGLTACTSYGFTVSPRDAAGNLAPASNRVDVRTHLDGDPEAATGLTATPHDQYVTLSWSASPSCDVVTYSVLRSNSAGGPYAPLAQGLTSTSHQDLFLTNGTPYFYVVVAVDSEGRGSTPSGEATATPAGEPPGAPVENLAATALPAGRIRVDWTPPPGAQVTTYRVYRSNAPILALAGATQVGTPTAATFEDLPPSDGTWHYTVTWLNVVNRESLPAASVSAVGDRGGPTAAVNVEGRTALGVGTFTATLTLSEDLPADPTLSFQLPGGTAQVLVLVPDAVDPRVYTAVVQVPAGTTAGNAVFAWTGTDGAGNTGNTFTAGGAIAVDGVSPTARIVTAPASPVRAGSVLVTVEAVESLGAAPGLTFTPQGGAPVALTAVGSGAQWTAVLEVTSSTGDGVGQFAVTLQDAAGNPGATLTAGALLTVDTVAPGAPDGVVVGTATLGQLTVTWNAPVGETGLRYCLYRDSTVITDVTARTPVRCDISATTTQDLPPGDGTWHYVVTAVDVAGNVGPASASASGVSDQLPPQAPTNLVAVVMGGQVTLSWDAPGGEPAASYAVYRDTVPFGGSVGTRTPVLSGVTAVTAVDAPAVEGLFIYVVVALDAVGLASAPSNEANATVDVEAPRIEVAGVQDGVHRNGPVTALITVTDLTLDTWSATLNGQPYTSGTPVTAEGSYTLAITAQDQAAHTANRTITFVIDLTAPVIRFEGVANAGLYETPPTVNVVVEDLYPAATLLTLNGRPFTNGALVEQDGGYTLTANAVDRAGNSTNASITFTVDLPPAMVALAHAVVTNAEVRLSWSASLDADVSSYRVRRNGQVVYTGASRDIAVGLPPPRGEVLTLDVAALDAAAHEGAPRRILLHPVRLVLAGYGTATPDGRQALTHGYFDPLRFQLVNDDTEALELGPLDVVVRDYENNVRWDETGVDTVAVGPLSTAPVTRVMPTHPDLVGDNNRVELALALPGTPGSSAEYRTSFPITGRFPPGATLEAVHATLVRGFEGEIAIKVNNHGGADLQVINQKGGPTDEMVVRLLHPDLTVLASAQVNDDLSGVAAGGRRVTTLAPGGVRTFVPVRLVIPPGSPDNIILEVVTQPVHHALDTPRAIVGDGLRATRLVSVVPPPYLVTATTDQPVYSQGDTVFISGVATATSDGQPAADVTVKLVVSWRGFKRTHFVRTDALGAYTFAFRPAPTDAGVFTVSATHPSVVVEETDATFTINGLDLSPDLFNLTLVKNSSWTVDFTLRNTGQTPLSGVGLVVEDAAPNDGVGATVDVVVPNVLAAGQVLAVPVTFTAALTAQNAAQLVLHAASAETGERVATVDVHLFAAEPIPRFDPQNIQLGVLAGNSELRSVRITNEGFDVWENVRITVPPAFPWLTVPTGRGPFSLAVGASTSFDVLIMPPAGTPSVNVVDALTFTSDNLVNVPFPMNVRVTTSAVGSADIKVTNLVYALTDPGRPVPNAAVTLQSLDLYTISHVRQTGADGHAQFTDIPAGRYQYWVRASGFKGAEVEGAVPDQGEITITQEQTVTLDVGLMETFVEVNWSVTPTSIQDEYDIEVETTFETTVPVPVVEIIPARQTFDLAPGETATGQIEVFNLGLVSAWDLDLSFEQDHYLDIQFAVDRIAELPARSSIVVPFTAHLRTHGSPPPTPCTTYEASGGYEWRWYCTTGGYWEHRRSLGFNIQVRSHEVNVSVSPNPVTRAIFYNCPGFENGNSEVPPEFTVTSRDGANIEVCDCGRVTTAGVGLPTLSGLLDDFRDDLNEQFDGYVGDVLDRVGVPSWDDVQSGAADAAGEAAFGPDWPAVKDAHERLEGLKDDADAAAGTMGQMMDLYNQSVCESQDMGDNLHSLMTTLANEAADAVINKALERTTGGLLAFNKAYSNFDSTCLSPGQTSRADVPQQETSFGLGTMGFSVAAGCGAGRTGSCCPVTVTYVDYTVICTGLTVSSRQSTGGGRRQWSQGDPIGSSGGPGGGYGSQGGVCTR